MTVGEWQQSHGRGLTHPSVAGKAVPARELVLEHFAGSRVENSDLLLSRMEIASDKRHETDACLGRVTPQPNPINSERPSS